MCFVTEKLNDTVDRSTNWHGLYKAEWARTSAPVSTGVENRVNSNLFIYISVLVTK